MTRLSRSTAASLTVAAVSFWVWGCSSKITESTRNIKEVRIAGSSSVIDSDALPPRKTGFSLESKFFLTAANASVIKAATPKAPRLMLFYLVGSDLEDPSMGGNEGESFTSQVGETSNDLRELIRGYLKLTPQQKSSVKVLAAFGGSLKEDWRGVKIADLDCLIRDGGGFSSGRGEIPLGNFGDDDCYLFKNPAKDIGSKAALLDFLKFAKAKVGPTSSVSLVMGDHGGALAGFGNTYTLKPINDPTRAERAYSESKLSVRDIADAIKDSELKIDLLGFDACLMGNFETAFVLRNSAKFLIAAPEVEPGHGWAYSNFMLDFVTSDSLAVFARRVIEDYAWYGESVSLDDNGRPKKLSHMTQNSKILSLFDLSAAESLGKSWDSFWDTVQSEDQLLFQVLAKGHDFTLPYSDMRVFAKKMADRAMSPEASSLVEAIDKAVIYVATDSSITADAALSMVNPLRTDMYTPEEPDFKLNDRIPSQWRDKVGALEKSWSLFKKLNPAYRTLPSIPCRGTDPAYTCVQPSGSELVEGAFFFSLRKVPDSAGELGVAPPVKRNDESGEFMAAVGYGPNRQSWPAVCDGPCATATKFAYISVKDIENFGEANKLKSLMSLNGNPLLVSISVRDEYLLSVEFRNPGDRTLLGKSYDVGFRAGDLIELDERKLTLTTDGFIGFRPLPAATDLLVWPITKYVGDEWVKSQMGDGLISKFYIAGQPSRPMGRFNACTRRGEGESCHQKCNAGDWNALQGRSVKDCRSSGCLGTRAVCFGAPEDLKADPVLTLLSSQDTPCVAPLEQMSVINSVENAGATVVKTYFCGLRSKADAAEFVIDDIRIMGLGANLPVAPACPASFTSAGSMPDCGNTDAKFCKGLAQLCVRHTQLKK